MKAFMDENFLLETETSQTLYHEYAAQMPIIDYHCHVDPKEIAQDRQFGDIAQAWLGGDHYKWRLMRSNGEPEKNVTGGAGGYEKFLAFARAMPKAIGNPVYQWAHLELKRYFDCGLALSPETADEIWNTCNEKLAGPALSVRGIIAQSNVTAIATTDDPADSLEWHKIIAADKSFATKVVPTFRPDKYINIEKPGFLKSLKKLGEAAGIEINTLGALFNALKNRVAYFGSLGCRASDHGLDYLPFADGNAAEVFQKALNGLPLSDNEIDSYKTGLLLFLGGQYAEHGWIMQLHYGALRNTNTVCFRRLGPDTGFDAISARECSKNAALLLDLLEKNSALPKTILYSINPNDDAVLQAIAGSFPSPGIVNRVQHGSAWWFNDSKPGMESQIAGLASRGLLGGFLGMLTDSRSFLSYARHEYFRRVLCNLIGKWVENGECPCDMGALGEMVQNISFNNTKEFFGF